MFLLTHEITNLISQAQDESLFVRRLETGADLLFHFLARLNCKEYKGVFSVNSVMVVLAQPIHWAPGFDEYLLPTRPELLFCYPNPIELLLKSSEFRVFPNRLFPSRLLQIF